jgi:hypothetical protein
VLVDIDEGNNEGVCDDVLDMEKIVTVTAHWIEAQVIGMPCGSHHVLKCRQTWLDFVRSLENIPEVIWPLPFSMS